VSGYLDDGSAASAEAQVVSGDVTLESDVTGQMTGTGHPQASCTHDHTIICSFTHSHCHDTCHSIFIVRVRVDFKLMLFSQLENVFDFLAVDK